MTTRWFFSSAQVGASAKARGRSLDTSVTFMREMDGRREPVTAVGPRLSLVGPGDVIGFDRAMVLREEPPPGAAPAAENILASIEFAHADLPWLLSPGPAQTPSPQPWIVLVVLAEDEAEPPREGNPLPVLTAPVAALPPLADRWAWAHVEARLDDRVTRIDDARSLVALGARQHSAEVIARLLCPRKLKPDRGWIAAVVPATEAGRAAGLNTAPVGSPTADAWRAGGGGAVELPVYHWWRFRTGKEGTFEELARRLDFRPAAEAGLGTRTVDVSRPGLVEQESRPATVTLDGALRVPGATAAEVWSDTAAQESFKASARIRLDDPARRRAEIGDPEADPDTIAVAPPLYGSDHTGQQTVPLDRERPEEPESWMTTLNLEVRRRVAAALGARYVQLEQEFLMARAWEQVGEIRQANRLLAVAELAAATAEQAQRKHLDPLNAADLVVAMAPASTRMRLSAGRLDTSATLATLLAASPVPTGAASSSFARLTRRGGALARRAARGPNGTGNVSAVPVITQGLLEMGVVSEEAPDAGLPGEVRALITPFPLQWRRMVDRIPIEAMAGRSETEARPLRPIMAHPTFSVPIATELLARWPEWAVPGIGALPMDTVTLLETNPEFVAALLVGLNHEFNRELLWREFPTDQRGTSFARFWPSAGADVDEIARWPLDAPLGDQLRAGGESSLALLVRGELLRRFPGTALLAVRGEGGKLPATFGGATTAIALDESTVLYLLDGVDRQQALDEDWFFVFREPMRGTQFGFDSGEPAPTLETWADLTWEDVGVDASGFIRVARRPTRTPSRPSPDDPPAWGRDAADMARIAFQQPFQMAFRAAAMLGD
ncbi:hypothetical protein [Mesorhizobium sp. L-8-3]|uniref:hypothetical protein n=1 Tax=Mesorhizobium sp. L-8-3 TaxID=2744522 RepID=UPI0019265925|nr:hypothetical protein [Mesorhizobium sp. L-8-3]BCH23324.1 hypothetical protein MesoLjLb_31090 [Mesorhizobium sp. L-8-3]